MLSGNQTGSESRVHICAPHGRDAQLIADILTKSDIQTQIHTSLALLSRELGAGAAAAIVTEEALVNSSKALVEALKLQPPWSDLPIIILTTGGDASAETSWHLMQRLDPIGNVSLLERPLRSMTLVSAVQVALRSRARQYEVRSLYEDLERRVAERTVELQRLNEEAEGFSYTVAHDLRSPLRAIISTSRILLEEHGPELSPSAASELNRQADAAMRMATLIDDLLRLSRLSREEMRPFAFDLSAVAHEAVDEICKEAESRRCQFEVQAGMKAYGDPLLIRFALLNLIQNAWKFSPKGGLVSVGMSDGVYFVEDHGIGFDPAYAKKIFQPFERLVDQKEVAGTGIGLANVRRIIERHGGKVWAESAEGKGSRFCFTLGGDGGPHAAKGPE